MPTARLLVALLLAAAPLAAQTGYRNLDGGRPTRIEDATPTELNELEIEVPTLRLERLDGGFYRWRLEPKLSFGALPHTELELRVPLVYREGAASPRGGLAGVGFSAAHALNTETLGLPAVMLGGEALVAVGSAAAPVSAASARAMLTRTFRVARLHLNGSFGNYGVVVPPAPAPGDTATACPPGTIRNSQGTCVTLPPDFPCLVSPSPSGRADRVASACRPGLLPARQRQDSATVFRGTRWAAGLGLDRAFPLRSLLLVADVFVERLGGLGRPAEWSYELGARQQLGVRSVADAGWGRRFTGPNPSWYVNAGLTYAVGVRQARRR